jgi:hypothetical protein
MLTAKQIMKQFGCTAFDAKEILAIQKTGFAHGKNATVFATEEDFEDAVGLDIEHTETLMFAETGSVRAVYDAAVNAGSAARKKAA